MFHSIKKRSIDVCPEMWRYLHLFNFNYANYSNLYRPGPQAYVYGMQRTCTKAKSKIDQVSKYVQTNRTSIRRPAEIPN